MKRLLSCVLSLLLVVLAIAPMTAAAAETAEDGVYAVATTVGGSDIVLSDAPDADAIGALDSYELIIEEEPVLTVEQSDIPDPAAGADNNGYFSADFAIPGTTRTVYLVGLTAGKVEEIQSRIIDSYVEGGNFELTDLTFIDAEKTREQGDGDDNLCWAASSSDILTYTGWAARAGFDSADDLFEAYIDAFSDKGGNAYYALGWFFNGVNTFAKLDYSAASAAAGSGGYLKSHYAFDMLSHCEGKLSTDPVEGMSDMFRRLREGCGVSLGLDVYYDYEPSGGHAVTCWGYIADTAYEPTVAEHYVGLFITDSDSDEQRNKDRREAPNVLLMAELIYDGESDGYPYFAINLDSHNFALLSDYTWLLPYSSQLPTEHDLMTSRDKTRDPDLSITQAYLGTDFDTADSAVWAVRADKIESNTNFYYTPVISNESDVLFSGRTDVTIVCTDANGSQKFSITQNPTLSLNFTYYTSYPRNLIRYGGLPEGDYTITMSVNQNHSVTEAYYYNNTYSFPLKVRDSYLLGDTDGDGVVNIMDATKIQRILAFYDEGEDAKMLERASVVGGGLSIVDATIIQRHLSHLDVPRPVGGKQLYE